MRLRDKVAVRLRDWLPVGPVRVTEGDFVSDSDTVADPVGPVTVAEGLREKDNETVIDPVGGDRDSESETDSVGLRECETVADSEEVALGVAFVNVLVP